MRRIFPLITIILFCLAAIQAQVEETAPVRNYQLLDFDPREQQDSGFDFRGPGDTLSIPFLDDFSYGGMFPSEDNWCDKSAFVNQTFAFQPPSIGVATLDGLGQNGSPYGVGGYGDTLTSKLFFLGGLTEADFVYLSFFQQAKGLGDKPEVSDSLIVEFKDINDNWVNIQSYAGIDGSVFPGTYIPDFSFVAIAIPQSYLYDGFAFRFRNRSGGTGQVDLWHLDYIRLTANAIPTENFNDVAFTETAPGFLQDYSSMPWRHFVGFEMNEMTENYSVSLYNHFPVIQEIQNRDYMVDDVNGGTVLSTAYLTDANPPIPLGNVEPGVHVTADKTINAGDYSSFLAAMQGLPAGASEMEFESRFEFTQSGQDPAFPASFQNDIITKRTIFSDYFAYDDGTAESNIKAQNASTQVAVKFHTNIGDTLKAIRMHIPHVAGDASIQLFNLRVWLDLDQEPIFDAIFQRPIYVDEYTLGDTLQGFTTYQLKTLLDGPTPQYIPPGDFYVGWQQVSDTDNPIPIGFDKNTPSATQFHFFNAGGGWTPFPETTQGAILIRPVMGEETYFTTSNTETLDNNAFRVYPNPVKDVLAIESSDLNFQGNIEIFDATGKRVWDSGFREFIPVPDWSNGLYIIRITEESTGRIYSQKFIVQH